MASVSEADRIETLDVMRGFALLGILLLNILGFGLHSAAYSYPGFDLLSAGNMDLATWATVELLAEGAMRCLFSILFGAGVLLFLGNKPDARGLHFRRTFLLGLFGLFDLYILLWNGDILFTYALAGMLLYACRNTSTRKLLIASGTLILLMSLMHTGMRYALMEAAAAAQQVANSSNPETLTPQIQDAAISWQEFVQDYKPDDAAVEEEYAARRDSYKSAFWWNAKKAGVILTMVIPVFLLWDALAMMLLGMALYRLGILQGQRSRQFYLRMMIAGFFVGLSINGLEVYRAVASEFDIFYVFAQMQGTYHFGRLGMAFGYIGLLGLLCKIGTVSMVRGWLAAVGRLALTNYLLQSLLCLMIFTGAGLSLVGEMSRSQLYPIVLMIWVAEILFSVWWLRRFKMGPIEWLWRALTYGQIPVLLRR